MSNLQVSKALTDHLDSTFPDQLPTPGTQTAEQVFCYVQRRVGAREVIEHLKSLNEELQNDVYG